MIVADTNLIAYLLIKGQRTDQAETVYRRDPDWVAPLLWRSEFLNVLAFYERRGLLALDEAVRLAEKAEALMQEREFEMKAPDVLELASSSRISAYDCEFAVLARQLSVPLVTADGALLAAFPDTAVSPERFAAGG